MLDDDSQQIINTRRKQKQPSSLFGIASARVFGCRIRAHSPLGVSRSATNNRHATRIHSLDVVTAANSSIQLAVELVHLRSAINQYSQIDFPFDSKINFSNSRAAKCFENRFLTIDRHLKSSNFLFFIISFQMIPMMAPFRIRIGKEPRVFFFYRRHN